MADRYQEGMRVAGASVLINLALALAKAVGGVLSGSQALIADAVHSGSDLASTLGVMAGMAIARRPADQSHPYGHGRAESLAAVALSLLLLGAGTGMALSSLQGIRAGGSVPGQLAIWIAGLSWFFKEGLYQITSRVAKKIKSPALEADALHHRSDAFSSIASLVGIIGARMGFPVLDPLAGIAVAFLVIKMGLEIFFPLLDELMEGSAEHEVIVAAAARVAQVPEARGIDEIKGRRVGARTYLDLKVKVCPHLTVERGHAIAKEVKAAVLEDERVADVIVHINPDDCSADEIRKEWENWQP